MKLGTFALVTNKGALINQDSAYDRSSGPVYGIKHTKTCTIVAAGWACLSNGRVLPCRQFRGRAHAHVIRNYVKLRGQNDIRLLHLTP